MVTAENIAGDGDRPRILVVDDERLNRQLVSVFLHKAGYDLLEAESGQAAVALARTQLPDLVLLDVMMPGMNGFDATRELKLLAGDTFLPIVLVTALGDTASRVKGFDAGADEFLQKPVDKLELHARVRNLLHLRFERRMLSEQNKRLMQLQHFQQLATSLIVHDLKNPLAILTTNIAYASSAIDSSGELREAREALEDSVVACRRLQRRISEVLDTARSDEGRLTVCRRQVRIDALIADAGRAFDRGARDQQVKLRVVAPEELVFPVDEDLVRRVIENLLENGLRYTPPGTTIEVRATAVEGGLELRVANEGLGIHTDLRTRIFDRFFQAQAHTADAHQGLGLYFCRLAIEAHGGTIAVVDDPTFATCFRMFIPAMN